MEPSKTAVPAKKENRFRYFFTHFWETGNPEHVSGYELFFIFVVSALIGSLIEMLWCRFSNGYWEARTSVVYGPFSFAEAIGGTFLTLLLYRNLNTPAWKVFLKSFFWCSLLEYVMSWGEETFTGYRSWDYSNRFLNINGRICFLYALFWGLLGVVWIKLIYPLLKGLAGIVPKKAGKVAFYLLLVFLVFDIAVSVVAKSRFTARCDGIPPRNAFEQLIDRRFPDERIIRIYPNSVRIDENGNAATDTLNHSNEKAAVQSSVKQYLKKNRARHLQPRDGGDPRPGPHHRPVGRPARQLSKRKTNDSQEKRPQPKAAGAPLFRRFNLVYWETRKRGSGFTIT